MDKLIEKHLDKFNLYYEYLIKENEKYNLTAITDKEEVFIKHFADSLSLNKIIKLDNQKLLDVGSGAGFPAIPLKICYEDLEITIIEPTQKRVKFLNSVIELLNLKKIKVICSRAEEKALEMEETFDIVSARAVANMSPLAELLVRYAKVGGYVVAYKGDKAKEEVANAKNALERLSLKVENIYHYELDNELGSRELVVLKKQKHTNNKYPRRYAEIKKYPL